MSNPAATTRSVVIERVFPHPPEKLWRALTEKPLLAQWLMRNDMDAEVGHQFQFRSDPVPHWDGVIDCEVLVVEPLQRLSYSWSTLGSDSVVSFTLTPADGGTHLRMEHSGFRPDQKAALRGAHFGWQKFLGNLERVVGGMHDR
jgi:uncharacterized protein YndB with AHSA1/START domain